MFPKLDMAKEKEDLEKWQTETTESITNTIMADSSGKRGDTTTKKWQSAESSENVTNAMMTGASSSNKTVEVAVPASENIGPASGVIDNQTVAEARDMAVEDTNRLVDNTRRKRRRGKGGKRKMRKGRREGEGERENGREGVGMERGRQS